MPYHSAILPDTCGKARPQVRFATVSWHTAFVAGQRVNLPLPVMAANCDRDKEK